MRRCNAPSLAVAVLILTGLGGFGCPSSSSGGGSGDDCPPGQVEGPLGNCISEGEGDDTGAPTDTGSSSDTDDDQTDRDVVNPEECTEECASDEFCLEGECTKGAECTPDEPIGCVDDETIRVCTEKGVGFRKEKCPSDKPNCVSFRKDGCNKNEPECFEPKCTDKQCAPDEKFCKSDGVTLMQCNSDGSDASQVELCRGKCSQGECVSVCQGNAKSYIGCGFHAVDMDNYEIQCGSDSVCQNLNAGQCNGGVCECGGGACRQTNANAQQYAVTVSNTSDSKVTVDFLKPDGSTVKSTDVQPGQLEAVDLPPRNPVDSSISNNSYRIDASGPVTAHQFNPKNQADIFTNDASLLLPSSAMGKEYTVIGWSAMTAPSNPQQRHQTARPYVTVVAVQQGTTQVQVEPTAPIISGNGVSALSSGDSASYTLSKGEVVQLMAEQNTNSDLTGTTVSADQKVAVFSGHECSEVPTGTQYCDHLEQQLVPESTWGKKYILSKFKPRGSEPDKYRIVAAQDNTTIETQPPLAELDGETLNEGETLEFELEPSIIVSADKPISVGQFMVGSTHPGVSENCTSKPTGIGDPAFMVDVPQTQFRKNYVVFTPDGYAQDWINIVKRTRSSVTFDGSSLSKSGTEIGSTGWEVIRKEVQPGTHTVEGSAAFGLYAYGYECDVSYAYPGGLDLATQRSP